jgi:hypothetical protein
VIDELVQQGWQDHEKDSAGVFERLVAAIPKLDPAANLLGFLGLLTHVAGEHLGRFEDGLAALERLAPLMKQPDAEQSLLRSKAALLVALGDTDAETALIEKASGGSDLVFVSNRIRVNAVAASALAGQRRTKEAIRIFEEIALLAAVYEEQFGKRDPANRALAVTGNNLACSLEEKKDRTADEDRLLEMAANTGRKYWEIAGTWLEVERAEYRLCFTYLALGRPKEALAHAKECLAICEKNGAEAEELGYAKEAVAKAGAAVQAS